MPTMKYATQIEIEDEKNGVSSIAEDDGSIRRSRRRHSCVPAASLPIEALNSQRRYSCHLRKAEQ